MKTSKQQRFHTKLMSLNCAVTAEKFICGYRNQLHHCAGRAFKLNGECVGEWYVYPLAGVIHDPRLEKEGEFLNIGHRHGSGGSKSDFKRINGRDIDIFVNSMEEYESYYGKDDDVDWDAIELIQKRLL